MNTSFIAALALFAAPAFADNQVEVEFTFDLAAVESEAGLETLEPAFRDQAREACTYQAPLTRTPVVDHGCVDQAIDQAFAQLAEQLDRSSDVAANTVGSAR